MIISYTLFQSIIDHLIFINIYKCIFSSPSVLLQIFYSSFIKIENKTMKNSLYQNASLQKIVRVFL